MKVRRHLRLVSPAPVDALPEPTAPLSPPAVPAKRQPPPLRPARPSAAVRKALRRSLASADKMLSLVAFADPRFPQRAAESVEALGRYGVRVVRLADELRDALACEQRLHLWRKGRRYVE